MAHGLDLPILNPNNVAMMSAIDAFRVLYNRDRGSAEYIQRHANTPAVAPAGQNHQEISLRDAVLQGLKAPAADAARRALSAASPETLINDVDVYKRQVLTKADKLKKSQYEPTLERFRAICEPFGCREVVLTSSDSGLGMDRVKQLMEEHLVSLESE